MRPATLRTMGKFWNHLRKHYALTPLAVAMAGWSGIVFMGIKHNIIEHPESNWNWGSMSREANQPADKLLGKDNMGIDHHFITTPMEYLNCIGGQGDRSLGNFPADRPPIEQWVAEWDKNHPGSKSPR